MKRFLAIALAALLAVQAQHAVQATVQFDHTLAAGRVM